FRVHCWLAPPLHVHTVTAVPFSVPWPNASRHLPPEVICPPVVVDQTWPAQSETMAAAPSEFGAVRQPPEPEPWMRAPPIATVCPSAVADAVPYWMTKKIEAATAAHRPMAIADPRIFIPE